MTLSSNDTFVTRNDADEVDGNGSGDEDEEITIPANLASGDYFLLVVADDRNDVTESSEGNNVFAVPFTVSGGDTGGGGDADLAVSGVSVSPTSGDPGSEVSVSYTLTNRGTEESGDSQIAFYFSTDRDLGSSDVLASREDSDGVDAGDNSDDDEDITVPASLASGDYFILVVADNGNTVTESNERNNVAATPFTVTGGSTGGGDGMADLRVVSASAAPSAAEVGQSVQVSYTLANDGESQAGSSQIAFYFSTDRTLSGSDVLAERNDADEVDAGSSGDEDEDITVPSGLNPGDYFILVVADDQNGVSETRENNNVRAIPFEVLVTVATAPEAASGVALFAPAPNPTAGAATLSFRVETAQEASLEVFDALGRRVALVASGAFAPGTHAFGWSPEASASGVYVVRLTTKAGVVSRRLTVAR